MDWDPEPRRSAPPAFPAQGAGGVMEPRAVADAVETGEEDMILEALHAYNREVSGTGDRDAPAEGAGWGSRVASGGAAVGLWEGARQGGAPRL